VDPAAVPGSPAYPADGQGVLAAYRNPNQRVLDKVIHRLDEHCTAFIALSPFATLATASADGEPDVSPRGGDPGFVRVLDQHRLALPDRQGNNRARRDVTDRIMNAIAELSGQAKAGW